MTGIIDPAVYLLRGRDDPFGSARSPRVAPLLLTRLASQALLVVFAPTVVAVGGDLHAPVSAVAQARSITAASAVAVAPALPAFLAGHVLIGLALACLLTTGSPASPPSRRRAGPEPWARSPGRTPWPRSL